MDILSMGFLFFRFTISAFKFSIFFLKNMEKQYYPQITLSGPESKIRAFVDREIVRMATSDYQFIKTFTMSRELIELLNYQCKIFLEPEIENNIATKIEIQRINGNFEAKPELNLFVGQYTNKYLNLLYENIKILKQERSLEFNK